MRAVHFPVRDRYAGVLPYEGKRLLHDAYEIA
jgi:hypothetical protein